MARFVSQTLFRSAYPMPSHVRLRFVALRFLSDRTESKELSPGEAEARVVQRIEDAIHNIIIKRSKPDWLHFVPGASYWVPPRRRSYGIEQIVDKLANTLTDEEYLSLMTLHGWPSSSFYINSVIGFVCFDLTGYERKLANDVRFRVECSIHIERDDTQLNRKI